MEPLILPGTSESLPKIAAYVQHVSQEAGLTKAGAYRLRLAVDEIATNIIIHGYQEKGQSGFVLIWAVWDTQRVLVVLEDGSESFDPRSVPAPVDLHAPPQLKQEGGLGVFLALKSVDAFYYEEAVAGGRNRSSFWITRDEAEVK